MSSTTVFLKSSGVVSAVALALFLTANSTRAEMKETTNWNASSFGTACAASNRCLGNSHHDGTYTATIMNGQTHTQVHCTSSSCTYTSSGGGGSPARVAPRDKALGTGAGLGGILAGQAPKVPKKLDAGQRISGPDKVGTPKLDLPKTTKIDVTKVAAPSGNLGKDTKINRVR